MEGKQEIRSKAWCFTFNNYTEEDLEVLKAKGDYGIIGRELAPTTGTPHLQGYIHWKNKMRLSTLRKINKKISWRAAKGSAAQNKIYCTKEDKEPIEWGTIPEQGKRNDIEQTRALLSEPNPLQKISNLMNYQCIRVAEKWLTYNEAKRTWKPNVSWFHGPSGSGKTRSANEILPTAYTKSGASKWWDGYDGHEDVIIDDLRSSHCEFTELLMILDRYEKRIEHKGGMRQLRAKRIIITSIFSPTEMYQAMQNRDANKEPIEQLLRRIDTIRSFGPEVGGNTNPELPGQNLRESNINTEYDNLPYEVEYEWDEDTDKSFDELFR